MLDRYLKDEAAVQAATRRDPPLRVTSRSAGVNTRQSNDAHPASPTHAKSGAWERP
jgi:hypothetical protein